MLCEWQKVIPGGDKFLKRHKICDLHFQKEDVITEYVTKLSDGTEHLLKQDKACLRTGAISNIFDLKDF